MAMSDFDNAQNLKKYWDYRDRLKRFVYVSSNCSEAGTNIPAECISEDETTISWDDGNGAFNQYISVLATEYRILKNNKQDYIQTIRELYYALKSFERLDMTAESVYRPDHSQQNGDLNGFFIRHDLDDAFWDKYKMGGTSPYFSQAQALYGTKIQNSLDNCVHYLESFALVNALVDTETMDGTEVNFKQIAKDNTQRIIRNMQHPDDPIPVVDFPVFKKIFSYTWYLKNPVTGEPVPVKYGSGLDGTVLYTSYGFAKVANRILGAKIFKEMRFSYEIAKFLLTNQVTDYSFELEVKQKKGIFPIPGLTYKDYTFYVTLAGDRSKVFRWPWFPMFAKTMATQTKTWNIGQDDYKMRSLCATGNIDIVKKKSPYQVLIQKQFESSTLKYEHLPLLWAVVMNNFSYIKEKDRAYIKGLLDVAPPSGPYKFPKNGLLKFGSYVWSSPSRLVWPDRLGDCNKPVTGYFNGLDYMLLHNLYLLTEGMK
jgi:hypothetical protein